MLQNPCKTLSFKKNMVYKIPPGGEVNHIQPVAYSLSITSPVSLLANKFDFRSVLPGQVSSAAVNQICVIHEPMNSCKNLKIH